MAGLNGKYIKTYAPGSSEHLAILKHDEAIAKLNELITAFNATLTKLDSDAGVTDTDYNSTLAVTGGLNTATEDLIPSPAKECI